MKLHTDILDDIKKTRKLSPNSFQIFIFLMLFAKELDANGEINLPLKDIQWRLRVEKEDLENGINDLEKMEILSNKRGILKFTNWHKRNFSDSTERVKKHRMKRYSETLQCNTNETPTRAREQNRTETETEQKQKKDKEKKSGGKPPHISHGWYRDVFAPLFQQATSQITLCRAKEFGQARSYFENLSKLNPHASPEEITRKATLGAELVFDGWVNERGPFHWLKDPPNIGWLMSNVDKINLAITARESMTEEEIDREERTEKAYEDFTTFAENLEAGLEEEKPEQLRPGGGLLKPGSGH